MDGKLNITEIYSSIQGESSFAGFPCTFVRLTGCPLRCRWCDTAYAFEGGEVLTIRDVMGRVRDLGVPMVELTGGEPLSQPAAFPLIEELAAAGFKVLIETSGSEPIENLHPTTHIVMDVKCPGSGMMERTRLENLKYLKTSDDVKFVLAHREDFDWAKEFIRKHDLSKRTNVLFSTAFGLLAPKELARWIVDEHLDVRLQLQQHKYIWGPRTKGV